MKKTGIRTLALASVLWTMLSALGPSGAQANATVGGRVYDASSNFTRGVAGAQIVFTDSRLGTQQSVVTASTGYYSISLPPGRYYATALHSDFQAYSTNFGFVVVSPTMTSSTFNVFMQPTGGSAGGTIEGFIEPFDSSGNWAGFVGNVRIDFVSVDGTKLYSVESDGHGVYNAHNLAPGGYYVDVIHNGFVTMSSAPGLVIALPQSSNHADFDITLCGSAGCP